MTKKKSIKIRSDAFVARIVRDISQPPASLLFKGFVGKAARRDHVRIYSDAELTDYLEIPVEAILYAAPLSTQESPLGGSYLWVQRDALLQHSSADGGVLSPFLDGPVYRDYLKQVAPKSSAESVEAGQSIMSVTRFGCPGRLSQHRPNDGSADVVPGPGPTTTCARVIRKSKQK